MTTPKEEKKTSLNVKVSMILWKNFNGELNP